ncbi:MAG: hypothetical protein KKH72_07385 [Alphaproteobacteria bacterium]|nr:hypothetical protein [Alphaproteobacteria bacterium]
MPQTFPSLAIPYSRLSRLGFGVAVLILGYGGVGMATGLIAIEESGRLQQIWIGIGFLACALICAVPFVVLFRTGSRPVLSVDPTGIWDRRLTTAPIPWTSIARIEGIAPGFMERLVMPGSKAGKILLHIAPDAWDSLPFAHRHVASLHGWLLAGRGRLRILHGALDARFPLLMDALIAAEDAARADRQAVGGTSAAVPIAGKTMR